MPRSAAESADLHRAARERAHRLAGGLSAQALAWRPASGVWSIADGLEHLHRTAEGFLPELDAAIARGHAKGRRGGVPARYGLAARKMIEGMEGTATALRTSASLDPARTPVASGGGATSGAASGVEGLAHLDADTQRYAALCGRAEGLDLGRVKARYPFAPLLRLPLGAVLEITGLHALRHVGQMERVAEAPGFPR